MKWAIPAKTFLVGEYVALNGGPAIILTTKPNFEVSLNAFKPADNTSTPELAAIGSNIHPLSPAGKYWLEQNINRFYLTFHDPYQSMGGMGASSAQFLGAYKAASYIKHAKWREDELITSAYKHEHEDFSTTSTLAEFSKRSNAILDAYLGVAYTGDGLAPSGYDVIAQGMGGCVYLNRNNAYYQSYPWPFKDLAFILIHTGKKLTTHQHLQEMDTIKNLNILSNIVELTNDAFKNKNSSGLIQNVNAYYEELLKMNLVASHSILMIQKLKNQLNILAIKGCGALGADVLLLITKASLLKQQVAKLKELDWNIITTSDNL